MPVKLDNNGDRSELVTLLIQLAHEWRGTLPTYKDKWYGPVESISFGIVIDFIEWIGHRPCQR